MDMAAPTNPLNAAPAQDAVPQEPQSMCMRVRRMPSTTYLRANARVVRSTRVRGLSLFDVGLAAGDFKFCMHDITIPLDLVMLKGAGEIALPLQGA